MCCWSRVTSAEVRTATLGASFRPSNALASLAPPLSACMIREERKSSHHGRRPGRRGASSNNTRIRDTFTTSAGLPTPAWRTILYQPSTTHTSPWWKISTRGTLWRWWWSWSRISTQSTPISLTQTWRTMMSARDHQKTRSNRSRASYRGSMSA